MSEPPRFGYTKIATIIRDFDRLRAAIRSHDSFAAEEAWSRCERWLPWVETSAPIQSGRPDVPRGDRA